MQYTLTGCSALTVHVTHDNYHIQRATVQYTQSAGHPDLIYYTILDIPNM